MPRGASVASGSCLTKMFRRISNRRRPAGSASSPPRERPTSAVPSRRSGLGMVDSVEDTLWRSPSLT